MGRAPAGRGVVGNVWKWGGGLLSASAALVSILSYAHSFRPEAHATEPESTSAVRWVGILPGADTASSIQDTIQLAATVKDERGNALPGAATVWSSLDTAVASVDGSGTVVARGEGTATIVASVGGRVAHARIAVRQQPYLLRMAGDTVLRVSEGAGRPAAAALMDARGHEIGGRAVVWRTADPSVAQVDSLGQVAGVAAGSTTITATHEQLVASLKVEVVPVPASITLLEGDGQRAPAGRRVAGRLAVQVVSRSGRPVSGVTVRLAPADGAGQVEPATDSTDDHGIVRAFWTLGSAPGRQRLAVLADGVDPQLTVTAEAEPVPANTRVEIVSERLEGPVGGTLADPVAVRITDSTGVALADVPVSWTAAGGGTIAVIESRTDSLGRSTGRWTLGPGSGVQRAFAQVGNPRLLPRVTLMARALAGEPATATLGGNAKPQGVVGKPLKPVPAVQVRDRWGNPVAGSRVVLKPAAGSVVDTVVTTDSGGRASVRWTLGRAAGAQKLVARVEGISQPVELSASARPLPGANLGFVSLPASSAAGRPLAKAVEVELTDPYGNPVADQPIVFATKQGAVAPTRVMTDARGRARTRWTLSAKPGDQALAAAVSGTRVRTSGTVRAVAPRR